MSWLMNILKWLDGKKTNIGAALLLAAAIISQMQMIWDLSYLWLKPLVDSLTYIGGLMAGVGLGGKAAKEVQKSIDAKPVV